MDDWATANRFLVEQDEIRQQLKAGAEAASWAHRSPAAPGALIPNEAVVWLDFSAWAQCRRAILDSS